MERSYPSRPVVGVGAIAIDDDRVLLVERGREPSKGVWSLPGGAVELGESLEEAIRREVREEAGIDIRLLDRVEVFERIVDDGAGETRYHYVLIDYLCEVAGGTLQAGDDAAQAAWFRRKALGRLALTDGALPVIEKAFEMRRRPGRGRRPSMSRDALQALELPALLGILRRYLVEPARRSAARCARGAPAPRVASRCRGGARRDGRSDGLAARGRFARSPGAHSGSPASTACST